MRSATRSADGRVHDVDDAAVGEEHDRVGVGRRDRVVGDHHDGLAEPVDRLAQQREDVPAGARVERAGRLVGEDHLGPRDQRAGDGDALLLAARELAGLVLDARRRGRRARGPRSSRPRRLGASRAAAAA